MYSIGWSSVWTARWFSSGSVGMPLGTAHDASTPSRSSRRSQCSRRAWCSWMTKRLRSSLPGRPAGSGVSAKSRLRLYSSSLRAIGEILTIGHSTHEVEHFVELLQRNRVVRLVDVRTVPRSRRMPWFAGDSLAALLPGAGIEYVHEKRLGGFRRPRPDTPNGAWQVEAFRGYADHMESDDFRAAITRLESLALAARTTVMCAEAQWTRCHRRLISDALVVREWNVLRSEERRV